MYISFIKAPLTLFLFASQLVTAQNAPCGQGTISGSTTKVVKGPQCIYTEKGVFFCGDANLGMYILVFILPLPYTLANTISKSKKNLNLPSIPDQATLLS